MSINLSIESDAESESWPLSSSCVFDLARLEKSGYSNEVHTLAGDSIDSQPPARMVDRIALLQAVEKLIPPAGKLPANFQIRFTHPIDPGRETISRGLGGVLIDGIDFYLSCCGDYWRLSPGTIPHGYWLPPEMRGYDRFDCANIVTENMGIVVVEPKKTKASAIAPLLRKIRSFVKTLPDATVRIIVA